MSQATDRGNDILENGINGVTVDDLKKLANDLKSELSFSLARKVLTKTRRMAPDDVEVGKELALCTYKDEELEPSWRFARALEMLTELGLRDPERQTADLLTLGGAVHKRRWEHGGQLEDLYEALAFYRSAYEKDPKGDRGYGGVNAAYILQLLASRARAVAKRSGTNPYEAERRQGQADELRQKVAKTLEDLATENPDLENDYWFVVTWAENELGLKRYDHVEELLTQASQLGAPEWELHTTFRQLSRIARLQGSTLPTEGRPLETWDPAWQALRPILGNETERALAAYRGKVGLALSGGGFRASFFHLGVIARLAEIDVLRSVDVISTVSGGSIVGAQYYLEVQKLLQSKTDRQITRQDYIDIVRRVQEQFLSGVERNLRMRSLADLRENLRIAFSKNYTRSHLIGKLYERELYSRVRDGRSTPRRMKDLLIKPTEVPPNETFRPRFSNWRRRAKVPVLLINTTSLNSGHAWLFTASWFGEPPGMLKGEVDTNERYRRLYYDQAPLDQLKNYRLGYAVAASACVPGLFEPLVLRGLYKDRKVRLVDGGVHDNQGVTGLLDQGCKFVFCSDASGQMTDRKVPEGGMLPVLMRSSQTILMDRVREAEYQHLHSLLDSRSLEGLLFVHLRKNLTAAPVDWTGCQDPTSPAKRERQTPYGIDTEIQRQLSEVRTDLDSFTEVEAYSLMLSGYLMTKHEAEQLQREHEKSGEPGTWGEFDVAAARADWPFLKLQQVLSQTKEEGGKRRLDLDWQLEAAKFRFLKSWRLHRWMHRASFLGSWRRRPRVRRAAWIALICGIVAVFLLLDQTQRLVVLAFPAALGVGFLATLIQWLFPEIRFRNVPGRLALALSGWVFARFHLLFLNPRFLKRGRIHRLLSLPGKDSTIRTPPSSESVS